MITAIPMNDQSVAPHFSKALTLAFFNPLGQEIFRVPNPALASECSGKAALIQLLEQQKVERVFVRHIGEKMLGRLLSKAFSVFQLKNGRNTVDELIKSPAEGLVEMVDVSQATPSVNHEAKHTDDHSCCGGSKSSAQGSSDGCCGGSKSNAKGSGKGCCGGSKDKAKGSSEGCCGGSKNSAEAKHGGGGHSKKHRPQAGHSARHHSRGGRVGRSCR